jgi:hypothetical protein
MLKNFTGCASNWLLIYLCLGFTSFEPISPSSAFRSGALSFRSLSHSFCFRYFFLINMSRVTYFLFAAHIDFQFTTSCQILYGHSSRELHLIAPNQSPQYISIDPFSFGGAVYDFYSGGTRLEPLSRHRALWLGILPPGKSRVAPQLVHDCFLKIVATSFLPVILSTVLYSLKYVKRHKRKITKEKDQSEWKDVGKD